MIVFVALPLLTMAGLLVLGAHRGMNAFDSHARAMLGVLAGVLALTFAVVSFASYGADWRVLSPILSGFVLLYVYLPKALKSPSR